MSRLPFTKLSGAGNDFVLLDGSGTKLPSAPTLARKLCARQNGIGADGLLVLRKNGVCHFPSVDYYNADGSRAFCGNGTRCASWWAYQQGWTGRKFTIGTISGPVAAEVTAHEKVRIAMPLPKNLRLNLQLSTAGRMWTAHYVEVGVPHAVVEVKSIDSLDVVGIGRSLRLHKAFQPHGANIDFIVRPQSIGRKPIAIRTYERGVEDETLACGTGTVAAAFCAHFLYGVATPIRIAVRGGDILKIDFKTADNRLITAWLEGPSRITFHGEINL